MLKIEEILDQLQQCQRYRPAPDKSACERRMVKAGNWLLVVSGLCFVMLLPFAGYVKFGDPLSGTARQGEKWVAVAYVVVAVLWVLSIIGAAVIGTRDGKKALGGKKAPAVILKEVETDEKNVRPLMRHTDESLRYAQHYLKLKLMRLDQNFAPFSGKAALLFTVLAVPYGLVKDTWGLSWFKSTVEEHWLRWGHILELVALSFLAETAFVIVCVVVLKQDKRRYTYHLEIVELVLLLKSLTPGQARPAGGQEKATTVKTPAHNANAKV
ncbi:hypothetical protein PQR34_47315 [Paraburkholderia sediminicola]|uniref:hypothetical protein n=1 Tax=Paraburkholderia sediminicola TaxID=458836 RepID=UPI0038BC4A4E